MPARAPEGYPVMPENPVDPGTITPPAGDPAAPPNPAPSAPPAPAAGTEQQLAEATTRADQAAAERDELRSALDAVTRALNPNDPDSEQD
ncbi:hypothetical protein ACFWAX_21075, partial [Streptomyces sp. NPDC059956]